MEEKFLEYLKYEKNYSENTIINYQKELKKYLSYLKEHKIDYKKIQKDKIRSYLKYLDDLKYKNTSISKNVSTIRSFYNFLVLKEYLDKNIWNQIENPKVTRKIPNFLTTMELVELFKEKEFKTPYEIRNRLILELLFATGFRVSELIHIKLKDINLSEKSIRTLGKGKKERIVYYGEYAEEILNKFLSEARDILLNGKTSEYLFVGKNSSKLTRNRINEIVETEIE